MSTQPLRSAHEDSVHAHVDRVIVWEDILGPKYITFHKNNHKNVSFSMLLNICSFRAYILIVVSILSELLQESSTCARQLRFSVCAYQQL
jgi:hypothetical protein